MNNPAVAVDQWKKANCHRLIDCRWGCRITPEACRAYQARTGRYVIHFSGDLVPSRRANADFIMCFLPEPCPHAMSDEEAQIASEDRQPTSHGSGRDRRLIVNRLRRRERLTDPEEMLLEEGWLRSLVQRI